MGTPARLCIQLTKKQTGKSAHLTNLNVRNGETIGEIPDRVRFSAPQITTHHENGRGL